MKHMFFGAKAFNQPIGDWNVSKVSNMGYMFGSAEAFNHPIGNWDVSNVTDMQSMFYDAKAFNQPIGNWKVSKVTNMVGMFLNARAFNQPIGNWDVSEVTNMESMFDNSGYTHLKPGEDPPPPPLPPPKCMSQAVFDTCEKDEDGDPECKISLATLTKETAVRTHPPQPHKEGKEPNTTACFDRASLRRWLKNSKLNPVTNKTNPVTKLDIEDNWIDANMGEDDCVPQTEGGNGKGKGRKTKKHKSKKHKSKKRKSKKTVNKKKKQTRKRT